ncbi:AAA family ATPase, partial [Clostridium botulinum]
KNDTGQLMYKELKSFSSVAYKQRDIFNYAQDEKGPIELINNLIMISNKEKYITLLKEIKTEKDLLMDNIKSISKSGHKNYLEYWNEDEEDEIEEVIEPFIEILKLYNELHKLRQDIISKINNVLEDQVKLSIIKIFSRSNLISIIDDTIGRCRRKFNITYEKQRWLRKQLERIIIISQTINEWQFPIAVLNNDENYIAQTFKIEIKDANELLRYIRPVFNIWTLAKWPMDTIEFQYNTNNGINNKKRFMDSKKLSMGQKSVAMLLIILTAAYDLGDNRPLIIDQPEDDLDNIYIYSSLVKEFRKIKNSRQLIFATHNANIPISGDAENIIILESNGDNGFVKITGSIDKVSISEKVLNILEGGRQALDLRNSKYPPFIT